MPVSVISRTLRRYNGAGGVTRPLDLWMRRCRLGCLRSQQLQLSKISKQNLTPSCYLGGFEF
jgi:hypothetical protein